MQDTDIFVLEFLLNEGNQEIVANPATIAANIDFSPDTVRHRILTLRDAELVEYHEKSKGLYQLANRGRDYLKGDLTDEEIKELKAFFAD